MLRRVHRRFVAPMLEDVLQRRPYNAAAHFVDANVARGLGDKVAFTDSQRSLTYAQLQASSCQLAAALQALDLRAENRVILLFHDTVDHPVAFWGAIRAGIIPVPINTLLTAEQYHYLFADSRAAAAIVAGAGPDPAVVAASPSLPALDHRGRGEREGTGRAAGCAVLRGPAGAGGTDASHRGDHVGRGRILDVHVGLDWRSQGGPARAYQPDGDCDAHGPGHHWAARGRRRVLRGETVVLLRPRQRRVLSHVGRRQRRAAAGSADPAGGACDAAPSSPHHLLWRAVALRGPARTSGDRPRRGLRPPASLHFCGRGAARASRRTLALGGRRRHPRWDRLDRDAADLFEQPARGHPLRIDRQAGAGIRREDRRRDRAGAAPRRDRRTRGARAIGRRGLLEPACEEPPHLRGRMDLYRRQISP